MNDAFIGEIRLFAGNFSPIGWAFCQGQFLPITGNEALFSLIGTTYGGNGISTFALPDLAGRVPLHQGAGPGLTPRMLAETGGTETVALSTQQMPAHSHTAICASGVGNQISPIGAYWSTDPAGNTEAYSDTASTQMAGNAIGFSGGGQAHNNLQPYFVINYIIALEGIYPSRSE